VDEDAFSDLRVVELAQWVLVSARRDGIGVRDFRRAAAPGADRPGSKHIATGALA
jgi:hypothetical protein